MPYSPLFTPKTPGLPAGPNLTLSDVPGLQNYTTGAQNLVNAARIPNAGALEQASSDTIAALLNPPAMFPDVNRQAVELGATRGVPGSAASYGTGLRLTDEERLRRIALGHQLLSGAYGRNPGAPVIDPSKFGLTPEQSEALRIEMQKVLAARNGGGGGGLGGYGGRMPSAGGGTLDLSGLLGGAGGNPFSKGSGFGSGGGGSDFDLDAALEELGLSDFNVPGGGNDYDEGGLGNPFALYDGGADEGFYD